MKPFRLLTLALTLAAALAARAQATYKVGDVVTEVTNFVDRATGRPVPLSALEGRILFIDFFAHWCPFCQAAAPDLETGIDHWYRDRGGNPAGVPVLHIGANVQADIGSNTQATTAFVTRWNIPLVIQDTARNLKARFGPRSGQPGFAIINGVANSPSHRQWELLYYRDGYGVTDQPIETFRSHIDRVQAAPPAPPALRNVRVRPGGGIEFHVEGTARSQYRVQASSDFGEWTDVNLPVPADPAVPFQLPPSDAQVRLFRVIRGE